MSSHNPCCFCAPLVLSHLTLHSVSRVILAPELAASSPSPARPPGVLAVLPKSRRVLELAPPSRLARAHRSRAGDSARIRRRGGSGPSLPSPPLLRRPNSVPRRLPSGVGADVCDVTGERWRTCGGFGWPRGAARAAQVEGGAQVCLTIMPSGVATVRKRALLKATCGQGADSIRTH